ncbi:winged helix-turn-helix domain-containing protein [Kitasatospora sp. DSM 101779]|uniref:winged helix-turn-helix domain-containing protein n=1 Tax=Kitasatospora sp. DSM 101779 TaxID=2853165 RepID=UPI0021D8C6CA|nr:helix-turn-helix domain-containing protein [Kitasatospora sp. DSM 101779]MCU7821589.1 helix-turn-helix domain-containing protein [Kitasatospora sp. DSM 101779]
MTEEHPAPEVPPTVQLSDPRALKAYAHPTRMALVGLLRREGPLTATRAAELVGESVASCSFHLRQLAKYGLVEEAGGGRGREKPWRATALFTSWDTAAADPAAAEAVGALQRTVVERYAALAVRWLEVQPDEPPAWRSAAGIGDTLLHLTAEELTELGARIDELTRPYLDRLGAGAERPAGSRPVLVVRMALPVDLPPTADRPPPGHHPHDTAPPQGPTEEEAR